MDERLFPKFLLMALRAMFAIGGRLFPTRMARKAADLYLSPDRHPRPPREEAAVAAGSRITFKNGMHGFSWGKQADNYQQPVVLLIHGWSGRATQMHAFIEPLVTAGYHVIAADLPAHGESPGDTTNPPHSRDALKTLGEELGLIYAIVAHSFGSACSMWAIEEGMQVQNMVSLGAPTHYIHRMFAEFFRLPKRCTEQFVDILGQRMNYPADDIRVEKLISAYGYNIPTLIVHGRNDMEMPLYHAETNAQLIKDSELFLLDDCGHRKVVWDPRVVAKVTDWLGAA